jgi:hypothetical protein
MQNDWKAPHMRRKLALFSAFFIFLHFCVSAQTAVELDIMLQTQAVSCAQAAKFVLASGGDAAAANVSTQNAFDLALSRGWLAGGTKPDDKITLDKLSFLMLKAYNVKGGLMYSLMPGPRYAYKTMVSRDFIQGAASPGMNVSGERFLLILGKVLGAEGGN